MKSIIILISCFLFIQIALSMEIPKTPQDYFNEMKNDINSRKDSIKELVNKMKNNKVSDDLVAKYDEAVNNAKEYLEKKMEEFNSRYGDTMNNYRDQLNELTNTFHDWSKDTRSQLSDWFQDQSKGINSYLAKGAQSIANMANKSIEIMKTNFKDLFSSN